MKGLGEGYWKIEGRR